MDILIIIKWLTDYSGKEHYAPSIIQTMINIALESGKIEGIPFIGSSTTNQALSLFFFCNLNLNHKPSNFSYCCDMCTMDAIC